MRWGMDWSPSIGSEVDSYRIGLDQIESNWIGLNRIESDWIGLDQIESDWIGLSAVRLVLFRTEPEVVYIVSPELESGSSRSRDEYSKDSLHSGSESTVVIVGFPELIHDGLTVQLTVLLLSIVFPLMPPFPLTSGNLPLGNRPCRPVSVPRLQFSPWRRVIRAPILESFATVHGWWAIFAPISSFQLQFSYIALLGHRFVFCSRCTSVSKIPILRWTSTNCWYIDVIPCC